MGFCAQCNECILPRGKDAKNGNLWRCRARPVKEGGAGQFDGVTGVLLQRDVYEFCSTHNASSECELFHTNAAFITRGARVGLTITRYNGVHFHIWDGDRYAGSFSMSDGDARKLRNNLAELEKRA